MTAGKRKLMLGTVVTMAMVLAPFAVQALPNFTKIGDDFGFSGAGLVIFVIVACVIFAGLGALTRGK